MYTAFGLAVLDCDADLGFGDLSEESWTTDLVDVFLTSPSALVPGTMMSFDGFASAQDCAAMLDYLTALD